MGCNGSKTMQEAGAPTSVPRNATLLTVSAGEEAKLASTAPEAMSNVRPVAPIVHDDQSQTSHGSKLPCSTLRKARTAIIQKSDVDFLVTQFLCHDSGVLSHLNQRSKESTWKIQAGRDGETMEIKLHVEKNLVTRPEVGVECNGQQIYPTTGQTKDKLLEDFRQQWPFRGMAKGIHEVNRFEVKSSWYGVEKWFPAVLTKQRDDGFFEALISMPSENGSTKQVAQPAVSVQDIYDFKSGRMLDVPGHTLTLEVPAANPAHSTLCVDGYDLITHYFARSTPPLDASRALSVKLSKDRQFVEANVGHSIMEHYVSSEARAVHEVPEKLKHSWTIQIGPFAEHTIAVEKKWGSKIVTLSVDGEKFVEAAAEDIDCPRAHWECKFRFVGERCIDFDVNEMDKAGNALDAKACVCRRDKYTRECVITVGDEASLASACLVVDDVDFRRLPLKREWHAEENISCSAQAFELTYNSSIPYKVNEKAPVGMAAYMDAFVVALSPAAHEVEEYRLTPKSAHGSFWSCCTMPM